MTPDMGALFDAAIAAVDPHRILPDRMQLQGDLLKIDSLTLDLGAYRHLYVCGAGKAALPMALSCEQILGSHIAGGVIVTPEAPRPLEFITYCRSTHPLPSQRSIQGADALFAQFEAAAEEDLILFLLSGGASALIEKPIAPVTLKDMAATTKLLLENGCSIDETNAVRKHLSTIKGGRLARRTLARIVVLVISDVIGDDLGTIGSAPLYGDTSTYADVSALLEAKRLTARLPQNVRTVIDAGVRGEIEETPDAPPANVTHMLLSSNRHALLAAQAAAKQHHVSAVVDPAPICGDVDAAAQSFCDAFMLIPEGSLLLCGGETTVTVTGQGKGGRNQHFALQCLRLLEKSCCYDIICAGTDGIDGNSDAAGARISDTLYARIDPDEAAFYAEAFDSNTFFERHDAVIKTGYTGTNVMDIIIAYKGVKHG